MKELKVNQESIDIVISNLNSLIEELMVMRSDLQNPDTFPASRYITFCTAMMACKLIENFHPIGESAFAFGADLIKSGIDSADFIAGRWDKIAPTNPYFIHENQDKKD